MRTSVLRCAAWVLGVSMLLALGKVASAQVLTPNGSGVIADFASQSDAYQDSDPTGQIFGPAGVGPYATGAPLPGQPADPAPSLIPAPGNAFSTNGGGGWTSIFNDNFGGSTTFTAAQSTIDDTYLVAPLLTSDVAITIPAFRLSQGPAAPGYAYDQIRFGSNYLITTNPGLGGNAAPNFPMTISGQTSAPGAYAQCDTVIEYTWIPVNVNSSGIISQSGPSVSLGTLTWSFTQPGGGTFGTTLFSTGSLAATPAGDGMMSLTGHAWLAGDPFDMTMSMVPEPATLGVLTTFGFGLLMRRSRRV